jgi:hypothetical protein
MHDADISNLGRNSHSGRSGAMHEDEDDDDEEGRGGQRVQVCRAPLLFVFVCLVAALIALVAALVAALTSSVRVTVRPAVRSIRPAFEDRGRSGWSRTLPGGCACAKAVAFMVPEKCQRRRAPFCAGVGRRGGWRVSFVRSAACATGSPGRGRTVSLLPYVPMPSPPVGTTTVRSDTVGLATRRGHGCRLPG